MKSTLEQFQKSIWIKRILAETIPVIIIASMFAGVLVSFSNAAAQETFPEVISLPDGFQPEGIAIGPGTTFYVGSIPTGAIFRGDLRTGEGDILVEAQEGRSAIGLSFDERKNLLFAAGGETGQAFVYDARSGESVAEFQLTEEEDVFINDVVTTRDAAYFTNSFQPVFYRIPLRNCGEELEDAEVEEIDLGGDYEQAEGFNVNGIDATPDGEWLFIVQSSTGLLFRVDPDSGEALEIDLGDDSVPNGDGILLDGQTLYVVQNQLNKIAVVELSDDFTSGEIVDEIMHDEFDVPTTIAEFGNSLYAVNARFGTPPTEETEYWVVKVEKE